MYLEFQSISGFGFCFKGQKKNPKFPQKIWKMKLLPVKRKPTGGLSEPLQSEEYLAK